MVTMVSTSASVGGRRIMSIHLTREWGFLLYLPVSSLWKGSGGAGDEVRCGVVGVGRLHAGEQPLESVLIIVKCRLGKRGPLGPRIW